MIYILDTSSISALKAYFPGRFPSLWTRLDALVIGGNIGSVREVKNELDQRAIGDHVTKWVRDNVHLFKTPGRAETAFVAKILAHSHFRQLIGRRHVLRGSPQADPFVIAAAKVREGCVVTQEANKANAAKIPNACEHFGVEWMNLEGLMEKEGWAF